MISDTTQSARATDFASNVDVPSWRRPSPTRPSVAIVHDYLTQRGGAERVVLSLLRAFPGAPLYTAVYEPGLTFPEFRFEDVRTLWTNRIGALRRDHRRGLLLYRGAFSRLLVKADVVICSSSGFSHGVQTSGRKIVYCSTPARWLYEEAEHYLRGWPAPVRVAVRAVTPSQRRRDRRDAGSADVYLANSAVVKDRIARTYGIEARVVPPPADGLANTAGRAVPGLQPGFVLCVSRLLGYKNVHAVVDAFARMPDLKLVVVGDGPERLRLQSMAGGNVDFLFGVQDSELAWLYEHCRAVVCASYEDFGLTTLEAAQHGKPAAALRYGGYVDTVVEDQSGVFFETPDAAAIEAAVRKVLFREWDAAAIKACAARFSEASFARKVQETVAELAG